MKPQHALVARGNGLDSPFGRSLESRDELLKSPCDDMSLLSKKNRPDAGRLIAL